MDVDVRALLDPELAEVLGAFVLPPLDGEQLHLMRGAAFPPAELSGAVDIEERAVPGEPPVPVRVYREKGATGVGPGIVAMHGGGYVLGSASMLDGTFDRWCPTLGVVGVSVEYRLAPDTPYPGPLEDCYAALRWTYENAEELGIDAARIGITGTSAGGGLAAGLALLARDRGEVPLTFQHLDCPMLDDRLQTRSIQQENLYVWSRESNEFGWRSYLGDLYGTDDVPPEAAGRATDLTGLPPTFISVGAIDGFRDEDVDYAIRLNQAGVPCELHVYPGAPHGYQMVQTAGVVRRAARDTEDWLRRQLHPREEAEAGTSPSDEGR